MAEIFDLEARLLPLTVQKSPIEMFWTIMAPKSATLNLCREVGVSVLVLQEVCADLARWKSEILEEKHLPLNQFAHLNTIYAKLSRSKISISNGVTDLLDQVRSMLLGFDGKSSRPLEQEMELVRNDKLLFLEDRIEQLTVDLNDSKQSCKAKTTSLAWKHLVLQVLDLLDENRADKNQKLFFEFVNSLKHRDRMDTQKSINKQTVKSNMKKLVKSQITMVENHELDLQEDKLFLAKQKTKQEKNDWEQEKRTELQSIAQERLALQLQHDHLRHQQLLFEACKQEFEENSNKREIRLQKKSQELEERESLVNARFPELSEIEAYITDLLKQLDTSAKLVLQSVATPDQIQAMTNTALKGIAFAEQELMSQSLKSKETIKLSMPHVISQSDSGVQCNLISASSTNPFKTAQDHKGPLVLRSDNVQETALTGQGSLQEGPSPPHHPAHPFLPAVEPKARGPVHPSHSDKASRDEAGFPDSHHDASASQRSTEHADKNCLGQSMRQDSVNLKDNLSQQSKTASRAHKNGEDLGGTSEAIKPIGGFQTQADGEYATKSDKYNLKEDKEGKNKEVSCPVIILQMDEINQGLQYYCSMAMDAQDKTEKTISTLLQLQAEMKVRIQQLARVKEECDHLEHSFALVRAAISQNSVLFHQLNSTSSPSRSNQISYAELISKSHAPLEQLHDNDLVSFDVHCQDIRENASTVQPTCHDSATCLDSEKVAGNMRNVHMSKTGTVVPLQSPAGEPSHLSELTKLETGKEGASVHLPQPLMMADEFHGLQELASAENSCVHPSIFFDVGPKTPLLLDSPTKIMNERMQTDSLHNTGTGQSLAASAKSRSIQNSKEVEFVFERPVHWQDNLSQAREVINTFEASRGKINLLEGAVHHTDRSAVPTPSPRLPSHRKGASHEFKPEESEKLRIDGAVEKVLTQFDRNDLPPLKISGDKDGLRRYAGPANQFRKENIIHFNDEMSQNRHIQMKLEHVGGLPVIETQEENDLNQEITLEPTVKCNFQVEVAGRKSTFKQSLGFRLGTAEYEAKIKELEERQQILMIRERAIAAMVNGSRESVLQLENDKGMLHDVNGGGWTLINQEEFAKSGPLEKAKETKFRNTEIIRHPSSQQDTAVTPKKGAGTALLRASDRTKQREEISQFFSEKTSYTVTSPLGARADHLKNSAKRTSITGSIHKPAGSTRKVSLGLVAQDLYTGVMEISDSSEDMLSDIKKLDIKHIIQLQDLFRSKIAILESEFSQRIAMEGSFRPQDDREPCQQASQINTFVSTVLSSEDNIKVEDHIADNTAQKATKFPHIQTTKNARPLAANMAALPAIYLPSMSRFQAKGISRRVGGGFSSSAGANGEPLRYSSAPTGLVEYLTMQGNPVDL